MSDGDRSDPEDLVVDDANEVSTILGVSFHCVCQIVLLPWKE